MPGQANDAHIMNKIFPAKLRADTGLASPLRNEPFQLCVAEGAPQCIAGLRQVIIIVAAGKLDGLEIHLCRGTANDEGEVVRRTCCGAE